MQIASRQIVWNEGGRGTVVEVEMTPATGLRLRFLVRAINQDAFSVAWGEGKRGLPRVRYHWWYAKKAWQNLLAERS